MFCSNLLRARTVTWLAAVLLSTSLTAQALPPDFQTSVVWSDLNVPTAVRIAPNGQIFVAEKSGIIKVFDSLDDTTATVVADLRSEVQDLDDRGLAAIAIDPGYPARPYIYAFYPLDAPPGQATPYWNDQCPEETRCTVNSRLSRLVLNASSVLSAKQTIVEGWCHPVFHHTADDLVFDSAGMLLVSHGDGGSATYIDYGQYSEDTCVGDPPGESGALRAQDYRSSGDELGFAGTIVRINPDTGLAAAGNPLLGGDSSDDALIAYGLRNPFRLSLDSSTGRLWIAEVGWNDWEEIDTLESPTQGPVRNFGWPCYEGGARQSGYDSADLALCESLYATGNVQGPYLAYTHGGGSAAISGIALYRGTQFPAQYRGGLFYADYTFGWIRVLPVGANGLPDISRGSDFLTDVYAVDLQVTPAGELIYADVARGTNQPHPLHGAEHHAHRAHRGEHVERRAAARHHLRRQHLHGSGFGGRAQLRVGPRRRRTIRRRQWRHGERHVHHAAGRERAPARHRQPRQHLHGNRVRERRHRGAGREDSHPHRRQLRRRSDHRVFGRSPRSRWHAATGHCTRLARGAASLRGNRSE